MLESNLKKSFGFILSFFSILYFTKSKKEMYLAAIISVSYLFLVLAKSNAVLAIVKK
jgi:hypothetical protein